MIASTGEATNYVAYAKVEYSENGHSMMKKGNVNGFVALSVVGEVIGSCPCIALLAPPTRLVLRPCLQPLSYQRGCPHRHPCYCHPLHQNSSFLANFHPSEGQPFFDVSRCG